MRQTITNLMANGSVLVMQTPHQRLRLRVHGMEYNPMYKPPNPGSTEPVPDFTSHFHADKRKSPAHCTSRPSHTDSVQRLVFQGFTLRTRCGAVGNSLRRVAVSRFERTCVESIALWSTHCHVLCRGMVTARVICCWKWHGHRESEAECGRGAYVLLCFTSAAAGMDVRFTPLTSVFVRANPIHRLSRSILSVRRAVTFGLWEVKCSTAHLSTRAIT